MNNFELQEKTVKAATRFIERKDWEIVESSWTVFDSLEMRHKKTRARRAYALKMQYGRSSEFFNCPTASLQAAANARSSVPACPDSPPVMSMS